MSNMLRAKSLSDLGPNVRVAKGQTPPAPTVRGGQQVIVSGTSAGKSKERLQALGRQKPGTMNKTEQRFWDEWIAPRLLARDLLWAKFEAVTLKLAPDCRLTMDFFVMDSSHALRAIDVKGSFAIVMDDAAVKMRVAADGFPWRFSIAVPLSKKAGSGWDFKDVT